METISTEIKKASRPVQKKIDFKTYKKLIYVKTIFETLFKAKNKFFKEDMIYFSRARRKYGVYFKGMLEIEEIFEICQQLKIWESGFKRNKKFSDSGRISIEKVYNDFQKNHEFYQKLSSEVNEI